jgi:hypothetical protein
MITGHAIHRCRDNKQAEEHSALVVVLRLDTLTSTASPEGYSVSDAGADSSSRCRFWVSPACCGSYQAGRLSDRSNP